MTPIQSPSNAEAERFVGALELRFTVSRPIEGHAVMGQLIVERAVSVVERERLTARAENLRRRMESNREIGWAIGIVTANHEVTHGQGFDLLRQASQHASRKLRELAAEVIRTGRSPPVRSRSDPPQRG